MQARYLWVRETMHRKPEIKPSPSLRRALHRQHASMQLYDTPGDREPQARTTAGTAVKSLEDMRQFFGGNAATRIGYPD